MRIVSFIQTPKVIDQILRYPREKGRGARGPGWTLGRGLGGRSERARDRLALTSTEWSGAERSPQMAGRATACRVTAHDEADLPDSAGLTPPRPARLGRNGCRESHTPIPATRGFGLDPCAGLNAEIHSVGTD